MQLGNQTQEVRPSIDTRTHIKLNAQPVDGDINAFGHGVRLPDAIEDDVDGADDNLPQAVHGEHIAHDVEVFAFEGFGVLYSFL